jgi:outer membrane autotransporter protein
MKVKSIVAAAALSALAAGALAQTYAEVGITSATYKESESGLSLKSSPQSFRGLLGYQLNNNVAIEGMVGFGMSDDGVKVNGVSVPGVNFEVDDIVGIYAKGKVQLTEGLDAFARVGYARSKGTVSGNGFSESASDSGFSYGVGLSYAINSKISVNLDYMSYLNKSDSKATGVTVGLGFKF